MGAVLLSCLRHCACFNYRSSACGVSRKLLAGRNRRVSFRTSMATWRLSRGSRRSPGAGHQALHRSPPAQRRQVVVEFIERAGLDPYPVHRRRRRTSGHRRIPHHGAAARQPGEYPADQRRLSISGVTGPVKASASMAVSRPISFRGSRSLHGEWQPGGGFERISKCHPISLNSVNGAIRLSLPPAVELRLAHEPERRHRGGFRFALALSQPAIAWTPFRKRRGAPIRVHNVNGGISIHSSLSRRLRPAS